MRYAKFLPEHGRIGLIAPSFGCNIQPYRAAFDNARKIWTKMGYRLVLGPNCYEGSGIGISSTPESCATELMEAWCSDQSDVLISCGGGELMCETIEHVDFGRLREAAPKWFMGYSDNTNLTFLLATLCDTASIYGPCAAAFGMEPWHEALFDAFDVLTGKNWTVKGYEKYEIESQKDKDHPLMPYHVTEPRRIRRFPDTDVTLEGRLVGGCMDTLVNLLGTRYDKVREFCERYRQDGILWYLEACDFNVFSIRRALWQMKAAGWFSHVKGFLIGRPYCHGQVLMGLDQYEAVTGVLASCGVPILMDLDIGHLPPMMPLVCGSYAHIASHGNEITVTMQAK